MLAGAEEGEGVMVLLNAVSRLRDRGRLGPATADLFDILLTKNQDARVL